jgi:hypothetical protein
MGLKVPPKTVVSLDGLLSTIEAYCTTSKCLISLDLPPTLAYITFYIFEGHQDILRYQIETLKI